MKKLLLLFAFIVSINSFSQLNGVIVFTQPPFCAGTATGEAQIQAFGGTPPYTFTINPNMGFSNPVGSDMMHFMGLLAGTYVVEIGDDVGGTFSLFVNIIDPMPVVLNNIVSPDTCSACTGGIQVMATGGTLPYLYSIDNGVTFQSPSTFTGLCATSYPVRVQDASGCFVDESVVVTNTNSGGGNAVGQIATSPAYCNDGSMVLTVTGGSAPFEVLWNTGDTMFLVNNVGPGTYTATVTDAGGCGVQIQGVVGDSSAAAGCSTISGNVFADANNNCINNSELNLSGMVVKANPGNYIGTTDANGDYTLNLPYGSYTVAQYLPGNVVNNCMPSYAITTSAGNPTSGGNDFADSVNIDFETGLYLGLIRPFIPASQVLYSSNNSAITDDANIYYVPAATFTVSSTVPAFDSQNGDTLFWNNVTIGAYGTYAVTITGTTSSGVSSQLTFCHGVLPINGDSYLANNEACETRIVTGSYDPNDKQVSPAGDIYLTDQRLKYQIRFQNTGNDTAFTVVVMDTLSTLLDVSTFQFVGASHNCVPEIINNHILKFTFSNILLPDSTTNEALSHGHILFEISQSASNQIGDVIENEVGIYFDYNEPVITNTATSPIVNDVQSVSEYNLNNLQIYPNPATDQFTIALGDLKHSEIRIVDVQGKIVYNSASNGKSTILINSANWDSGIYMIQVVSGMEIHNGKVVVK